MKLTRTIFIVFLGALTFAVGQKPVWPCGGTPRPNCGRSVWMALLVPRNVVFRAGVPIQVPVGVMPYLVWNPNPPCAQPTTSSSASGPFTQGSFFTNANLTLNVTCTPVGGASMTLGPFTWNLDPPTAPGLQSPNAVTFDIPASTFDGSVPVVCTVSGTYTVNFGTGPGSGTLSASNQVTAYIVPASPQDGTRPRLDMVYFPTGEQETFFKKCRRGDQAYFYFLVTNNDLQNSVDLNVATTLDPRSGLPDGFDPTQASPNYQALVFSLQDPAGDFYAHGFADNPATWQTLPEGDPHNNSSGLNKTLTLAPGEARFIVVCVRSFGMCGNGSCNKLTVQLQGTFSDGTPALGCASSALLVEEVPAKSARCEIQDIIKAGMQSGAFWTPAFFFDPQFQPIPHTQTHYAGNANPAGQRQTSTFRGEVKKDYIRFDPSVTPYAAAYSVGASGLQGFGGNLVAVQGLSAEVEQAKAIPVIFRPGIVNLRVAINCQKDSIRIHDHAADTLIHKGQYSAFLESPPAGFAVDATTCRTFTKTASPNVPEICTDRYYLSPRLSTAASKQDTIKVFNLNGAPVQWTAQVTGDGKDAVTLQSTSGLGEIIVAYDLGKLPKIPVTTTATIEIQSPGALSPLQVPVAIRVDVATSVEDRKEATPLTTRLHQNYPNPFNPGTTIAFDLRSASEVTLQIYDLQGRVVRTLARGKYPGGNHHVVWDGRDEQGELVPSGLYLSRLVAGEFVENRKLLLVK